MLQSHFWNQIISVIYWTDAFLTISVCCVHAWQSFSQVGRAAAFPSCDCENTVQWVCKRKESRKGSNRFSCSCSICLWILSLILSETLITAWLEVAKDVCWIQIKTRSPFMIMNSSPNTEPWFQCGQLLSAAVHGHHFLLTFYMDSAGVFLQHMFYKNIYCSFS